MGTLRSDSRQLLRESRFDDVRWLFAFQRGVIEASRSQLGLPA